MILVDVSGSMKGLRLTIARQTVSSILDTLGDDDFFNIIAVSRTLPKENTNPVLLLVFMSVLVRKGGFGVYVRAYVYLLI